MTIALAFVTPAVAVAAFAMTIQSYYISKDALRVSNDSLKLVQRAYVAVSEPKLRFTDATLIYEDTPHVIGLSFNVDNLGNTPATIKFLSMTFSVPKGWTLESGSNADLNKEDRSVTLSNTRIMAPRQKLHVRQTFFVFLNAEALDLHRKVRAASSRLLTPAVVDTCK